MDNNARRLAVVTGVSSGIGLDLARLCAQNRYDLVIADHDSSVFDAAEELAGHGVTVSPVRCDLSKPEGVDALRHAITACGKPADILVANAASEAIGSDANAQMNNARANIEGTIDLIDQISRSMRGRGHGRILITYSIAGLIPHSTEAAHSRNKAFLGSFAAALCRELKHTGVTVSCLESGLGSLSVFECPASPSAAPVVPQTQTSVVAYHPRMASPIPAQTASS
jgi:short-subunit dehydrogenase